MENKKRFILEHIKWIKARILSKELPEHWEGLELKQYIADNFQGDLSHYWNKERKENYENDIIINNL